MRGLQGRTALVTGATGLLGSAVCVRLAEEGATVIVASRQREKAEHWCDEHRGAGELVPLELDVGSMESIESAFAELASSGVCPTVMVASAIDTRWHAIPFEELDHESFAKISEADLAGNFLCARSVVDGLSEDEPASIVLLSSIYGSAGVDHSIYPEGMMHSPVHYAATKAAVQGVTRWLAGYWCDRGIRVNGVVSGGIRDEDRQDDEFLVRYGRKTMIRRMAKPHEVAAACVFLASEDASYITGTCLDVEGGLLAW